MTKAPAAMTVDSLPPNASFVFEAGTTAEPASRRPTQAEPTRSGRLPYAFEIRTRTCSPPRLTRAFMRNVWLLKAAPSAGAGVVVQVPTQ